MTDSARLLLITPVTGDPDPFAGDLRAALAGGDVAAVLLRLAAADERTLVNRVKALVPVCAESGAALMIAAPEIDIAAVAIRAGADGAHTEDIADLARLRQALGDRSLGIGGLRTRDDAMRAGEAGVDCLLFGEPRPDGFVPDREATFERAAWWAEIFAPPCAPYAKTLAEVREAAGTGAEFVALGDAVWRHPDGPKSAVETAVRTLAGVPA